MLVIGVTIPSTFSQTPSDSSKFEIGIGIPYFPRTFTPFPVVTFKIVHNKNVFRSGVIYNLTSPATLKENSYFLINAGYERRFFKKKIQIILGVDLGYYYRHESNRPNFEDLKSYNYGIGPVVGLQYQFIERFSLQTEFGFIWGNGKRVSNIYGVYDKGFDQSIAHRSFSLTISYTFR